MSLLRIRVIRTIDGFTFAAIANAKAIVFLVDASLKINGFTLLNTRPICTPGGLGFSELVGLVPATLVSDNRDEVNDRLGLELELRDNVTDGLLLGDSVPEDVCESVDENEGDDVELSDIVGLVDIDKEIVGLFEFEIVGLFEVEIVGVIEGTNEGLFEGEAPMDKDDVGLCEIVRLTEEEGEIVGLLENEFVGVFEYDIVGLLDVEGVFEGEAPKDKDDVGLCDIVGLVDIDVDIVGLFEIEIVGLVDIDEEIVGLFEFEIVGLFDDVCDGVIELVEDGVDDGLLIPIHTSFAVSPLTPAIVATTLRFALTVLGK